MALITSPVPEIGSPNASEQVDATNLLTEIKNLLNGSVAADNLSSALRDLVSPPIVTALPGSPVAGQRVLARPPRVAADVATIGPLWPLRYNPDATGPHKWEADGAASPLATGPAVGAGFVSGSGSGYLGFGTWAATVPFTGVYNLEAGGRVDNDTYLALMVNNAPNDNWVIARGGGVGSRFFPNVTLNAGDYLAFAHRSPSGGVVGSYSYWFSLTPVRVSG